MYLTKKTYVKNWDFQKKKEKHKINIKGPAAAFIKPERISYITEEIAIWRKANQIHQWFVENCQDGEDNCKKAYVEREQLEKLLNLVTLTLGRPTEAATLLPCQPGFFFGSEEYDQSYFQDLTYTKKILEEILREPEGGEFYYQSSW